MNRDELIEAAARIFAAGWEGDSNRVNDSHRQLADGWLQGVIPLIESDLREKIAGEIEAEAERYRRMKGTLQSLDQFYAGLADAVSIVRGATADTDPAQD